MPEIKNIVFDFGGVLIDLDVTRTFKAMSEVLEMEVNKELFHQHKSLFEDYEGGHIKTSIHCPFSEFEQVHLDKLVTLVQEKPFDSIVFYCMYSEQRGPHSATIFAEKISDIKKLENLKVYVHSSDDSKRN